MVAWRWRIALTAAAALATAACGAAPVAGGGGTTAPDGTVASTVLAEWCDDVAPPGPIAESDFSMMNPDPVLMGVLQRYAGEHPDTYGGLWIDRAHGGTVVLAFTDDPAPHRAEMAGLTAEPGDPTGVAPVATTDPAGAIATVPLTTPPATTVAESGAVVDAVQVAHSESELRALQDEVSGRLEAASLVVSSVGMNPMTNRVTIGLGQEADDEARRIVAEQLPVDAVCLDGGSVEAPYYDLPATMIAEEGSDPWVTCQSGLMPVRLSALTDPPPLAPDDPLALAFEKQKGTFAMGVPGVPVDWYFVARGGDQALFAAGRPPASFLTMELEGDHWLATGSSAGGEPCHPRSLLPDGLGAVEWGLDPAYPPPAAEDTVVHLRVNELACTGGASINGRMAVPEIVERGDQVLLGLAVHQLPPGGYNCIGNPSEPVDVTLPGPLGDRRLADGTFLPPAAAEVGTGS